MSGALQVAEVSVPVAGGDLTVARLGGGPSDVVAVHGITSTSRAWVAVARALDGRASLLAVDLRGRGGSRELPPPYGLGAHVEDLLAVLDSAGIDRAVLVGHSLGAYVVARLAAEHPERVRAVLLVDGGLAIPGTEGVEPQRFADAFLGPALARLKMRFGTAQEYRDWWRAHPALSPGLAEGTIEPGDIDDYADYDLVGDRSSVNEEAVRADVLGLVDTWYAHRLAVPARMLVAPRGLLDDPNPMQPLAMALAWAEADPGRRSAELVEDVNHYTLTLTRTGAGAVADTISALALMNAPAAPA